jgi:hypothetical protein
VATRQSETSSTAPEAPRGWRAYQLPGGVPLLALLVPLAGIVLLYLLLTGRLSDGPSAQERADRAAGSIAAAVGLSVESLEQTSRTVPCPAGSEPGATVAEHVLRTGAPTDESQLVVDAMDYFGLNRWGHRRFLAGDDRAVRAVRGDQAALVTVTPDSVDIRVVTGPCAAQAVPEPGPPYTAG